MNLIQNIVAPTWRVKSTLSSVPTATVRRTVHALSSAAPPVHEQTGTHTPCRSVSHSGSDASRSSGSSSRLARELVSNLADVPCDPFQIVEHSHKKGRRLGQAEALNQ